MCSHNASVNVTCIPIKPITQTQTQTQGNCYNYTQLLCDVEIITFLKGELGLKAIGIRIQGQGSSIRGSSS